MLEIAGGIIVAAVAIYLLFVLVAVLMAFAEMAGCSTFALKAAFIIGVVIILANMKH